MMVANRTRRTPSRRAFKQLFTVRQQAVGANDPATGLYVAGADTDTVLNGSVQPADGELVEQLAEAERQNDSISIWTNAIDSTGTVIKIRSVRFGTDQTQGDQILYENFIWNVRRVWDYTVHGHQQILAVKVDDQNG